MAESTTITISDPETFKKKALAWANLFPVFCLLDSNNYLHDKYSSVKWLLGVDAIQSVATEKNSFEEIERFRQKNRSLLLGFLSYDLKNETEQLQSHNTDNIQFPLAYFFLPRYVLRLNQNKLTVNRNYPETFELLEMINRMDVNTPPDFQPVHLKPGTTKEEYCHNVVRIKQQIEEGDFYEMNYCVQFFSENVSIQPLAVFDKLNRTARAPFSTLVKYFDKWLLCASPERFLKKVGNKVISQPIKGTARKGSTAEENERIKTALRGDEKEQAENVMIVDLVRNDLSRTAIPGTVQVEELFGIYEFNTVNQMISTIAATVDVEKTTPLQVIEQAFPMGSMTGAPKVMVMKTIEDYETFKRGLFSGSVGYITEEGDFDFNVVIRSILYNESRLYLSVPVGSAITYDSVPEKEYEEVLLKAENIKRVLS